MVGSKKVHQVDRFFLFGARPPVEEDALFIGKIFTFDEHFIKCRMPEVRGLLGQDDLCITGKSQKARLVPMIGEGDAPNLHIVLWRDADGSAQEQLSILPFEFDTMRHEKRFTMIRRCQRGLWCN